VDLRFVQASGFNNNVYNNCYPEYARSSSMEIKQNVLPTKEQEQADLIKRLRKEGKITGPSGRQAVKLALFDKDGRDHLYNKVTKQIPVAARAQRFISPIQNQRSAADQQKSQF
jgi:hypothetical protein